VRSAVRSELSAAVERFDLGEVAERLPVPAREAGAPAGPIAASDAGDSAPPQRAPAAEESPEPRAEAVAEEAVEERELAPPAEFVRDLGAAAGDGDGGGDVEEAAPAIAASAPSWGDDADPPRMPDQDEWASLIRRMLAVYHQTRAVE
jgi:hypothetical protein